MRTYLILLMILPVLTFAQKRKKGLDVVSNIDVKVLAMKPIGNNSLSKDLQPFYGFGFGGNLMTPINFGVGIDYNAYFSNVNYERRNTYGNLASPRMTVIDAFLTHREEISEDFFVEEMAGFTFYRLTNNFIERGQEELREKAVGFHLGGKAIYALDGPQQVFVAGKANFYFGNTFNENADIRRYYRRSVLLSLSLGYRYNF